MQSTEKTTPLVLDIDAIADRVRAASEWLANHKSTHAGRKGDVHKYVADAPALLAALAAERDRADRAEAALSKAWDEGCVAGWDNSTYPESQEVNPYRSEATA